MTIHPQARLTHLPLQDVEFPASFAADFVSELIRACEQNRDGSNIYHSWKVCILSYKIGERLNLDAISLKELFFASLLHDIGGVMVGGHIIDLLGQTPDIYGQKSDFFIFAHPHRSETILRSFPTFRKISEMVGDHHEFFDGSGFPKGLKGEQIPLISRIIRVADAVDIISKTHHIDDLDELILFLNMSSGEEFDPAIYDAFVDLAKNHALLDLIKSDADIESAMSSIKKKMEDKYFFSSSDTLNRFLKMVAVLCDNLTASIDNHSIRVAEIAVQIAYLLKLDDSEILAIRWAAFLHDVGKLTTNRLIYLKKEKLSEEEWLVIKSHPQKSYEILNNVSGMDKIAYYVLYHHENFDGSGYPEKLQLEKIPLGSRILHIADAFEAMTSNRIYHRKRDWLNAVSELKKYSGTQFDPEIVAVFTKDLV